MALKIWETDPLNKPAERPQFEDSSVGRFHSGQSVDGVPEAHSEWRVATADRDVADTVATLFGGAPVEDPLSSSANFISILTDRASVPIVLSGPKALYSDLKLWNRSTLVHHCDGVEYLSPEDRVGRPCGCPELFAERKQAARDMMGPSPSIELTFRLADAPDLGEFKFRSGSWAMAQVLHEYDHALKQVDGPAQAQLTLELVEFTIRKGPRKGLAVSYYKPVLSRIRAHQDEDAA